VTAILVPIHRQEWRVDALCTQVGGDMWHVEKGESVAPAKAVCARCPVRSECLEDAIARAEWYGVAGGLSERERRRVVRQRCSATT
jgi:WhiB family redox-sensing transcriptional regulator